MNKELLSQDNSEKVKVDDDGKMDNLAGQTWSNKNQYTGFLSFWKNKLEEWGKSYMNQFENMDENRVHKLGTYAR